MMVPPLSERPVTEEDEEQFRRESMPRTYTLRQRWADYRADARANRPKGVKARVRAWLHVEPFYWGMRAAYVVLVVGAVFAVYINGVANGWWHAWGEKPTVAATTPAARPAPSASSSTEAAMSGGYQIGPDGVLVRPAEHAASTYTKPELPEEAKENTERGARARRRVRSGSRPTWPPRWDSTRMGRAWRWAWWPRRWVSHPTRATIPLRRR